jgi:hypothetical protein
MITNVNHHSPIPATDTPLIQTKRGGAIPTTSFHDVLVSAPSPNTASLPKISVPGRAPVFTAPAPTPAAATTPGSSTSGTAPGTITTAPGTYQTPFGTVVITQPVTPSLTAVFTPQPSSGVPVGISNPSPQQQAPPTPQSVFGDQVWMQNPTYSTSDGTIYSYNPTYYASAATAQKVANMVGGTVVPMNMMASGGGMVQNQPNLMVQLPDGKMVNPGLIADFYSHGYPQSYVNVLIQNEIGAPNSGAQNT